MSNISILGLISMVFVVWFTMRAYRDDSSVGGRQSRRKAIIEAWINVFIGFSINFVMNMLLLPLVGAELTVVSNLSLGFIYTSISIIRQYVIRRWFDERIQRFAARTAKGMT